MDIEVDADADDEDVQGGIAALVVAVVEILDEALEQEAVRRMESGNLTDEEIERLGSQLQAIEEELEGIKQREGIEEGVEQLKGDLDEVVRQGVTRVSEYETAERQGRGEPVEDGNVEAAGGESRE